MATEAAKVKADYENLLTCLTTELSIAKTLDVQEIAKAIKDLKIKTQVEVPSKSSKGCQVELLLDDSSEGVLNKDKLSINLREAYTNYFRLRDSNVEGRTDVFSSLYT